MRDDVLTPDKLAAMIEAYPPLPFVAFTFNPASFAVLKAVCKPHPLSRPNMLNGVEIWEVRTQVEDCLQWNDEEALRVYLEAYGVIEPRNQLADPDPQTTD